jgi:hypothetical protein
MRDILAKICALQPRYSSSNTPEMQNRGRLVRNELAEALRERLEKLRSAMDPIFDDLAVEASDGIGRKTEAPWVRFFSRTMSPNPREGFYFVIHFSADGSAVFLTIGCGSTIWSGGDLRAIPEEELKTRTTWAQNVILSRYRTLAPFGDVIDLGAKAALPKTFEKATALAKRVPKDELSSFELEGLLLSAAERLGEIYLAQLDQRDISQGDRDTDQIIAIAKPLRRSGRQGQGLNAIERKAVELRAMEVALNYLKEHNYECKDTSATESFDVLATKGGIGIKVEIKGTTSDICDSVMMTRNEVNLHRNEKGKTGLLIVSKICLIRDEKGANATGGVLEDLLSWDIDEWNAEPIAFQVGRRIKH